MKHYVYKITNLIEDKHYIGVRSAKNPSKDLGIIYFSSSSDEEFMLEQQEFPDRFKYEILEVFPTRSAAVNKEIELHNFYDVAVNESFYNKSKQTSMGFCRLGTTFNHTEEAKEKISASRIGEKHHFWGKSPSKETREKMSASRTGEKHFMWGKKHPEETKMKISESLSGSTLAEEIKVKISESLKGRKFSEETLAKMSKWQKGKSKSPEHTKNIGKARRELSIRSAYTFEVYDHENNLIHNEKVINFKDFCLDNKYPLSSFGKSYRTNWTIERGKFKGWRVIRIK